MVKSLHSFPLLSLSPSLSLYLSLCPSHTHFHILAYRQETAKTTVVSAVKPADSLLSSPAWYRDMVELLLIQHWFSQGSILSSCSCVELGLCTSRTHLNFMHWYHYWIYLLRETWLSGTVFSSASITKKSYLASLDCCVQRIARDNNRHHSERDKLDRLTQTHVLSLYLISLDWVFCGVSYSSCPCTVQQLLELIKVQCVVQ